MKYARILCVVGAALLAITGCKDESRQEIIDTFDSYVSALDNNDGAAAVELMDEKYFEDLSYLLTAAKTAPPEKVFRMRPSERSTIIAIRNRLTPEEVKGLDGRGLMKLLIEKRDPDNTDFSPLDLTIHNIKYKRPRATADMAIFGFDTTWRVEFVQIEGVWKINPACFDESFDKRVEKVSARTGKREDTLLQEREARISGKPVSSAIWLPPK